METLLGITLFGHIIWAAIIVIAVVVIFIIDCLREDGYGWTLLYDKEVLDNSHDRQHILKFTTKGDEK